MQDAINELSNLGEIIKVELVWIKAHVNPPGNELADEQAKLGTVAAQEKEFLAPPPAIPKQR